MKYIPYTVNCWCGRVQLPSPEVGKYESTWSGLIIVIIIPMQWPEYLIKILIFV